MKKRVAKKLIGFCMAAALASGCGSSSSFDFVDQGGGQSQLVMTEPTALQRGGDDVNSVSIDGFDANGNLIWGPVLVEFENTMSFPEPPSNVQTLQIDYLRNFGLSLFRAEIARNADGTFDLSDPTEQPTDLQDTGFAVVPDGDGFDVRLSQTGSPVNLSNPSISAQQTGTDLVLKGVCYSPAPIGFSNKLAPAIGDLFWDSVPGAENWKLLWGNQRSSTDFNKKGRGDLEKIRGLGANCIRVYSMMSRQLFVIENGQYIPGPVPSPPDAFQKFEHKSFLDACWNDGRDPLYVMVGIPLPETMLYKYKFDVLADEDKAFWEHILRETVEDTANHPAVLGYVLFNEHDEDRSAFPGVSYDRDTASYVGGEVNENTDFYYGQLKKFSGIVHDIKGRNGDSRKLVGWAAHDAPNFVYYGSNFPENDPYFAQLEDIDFYGVNTYQSINLDSVVGPTSDGRFLAGSYGELTGDVRKPVFLTEFGWVGTGHDNQGQLYEDETTRSNAAAAVSRMIPQAFQNDLIIGLTYFEFSDEWWKEPPNDATTWDPGPFDGGQPNGYHDQEGFGLFSTHLGAGRTSTTDLPYDNGAPVFPVDSLVERTEITEALRAAWANF